MENRVGMINYIEYTYNTNKGATKAGDAFASPLGLGGVDTKFTSSEVYN
jgi:hypothetical protein